MFHRLVLAVLIGFLAAFGVGTRWAFAAPPPAYFVDETKLPFVALPGTTTTRYWGIHNSAGYRIEVPNDWNGELVLYGHGFRGDGLELTVSNPRGEVVADRTAAERRRPAASAGDHRHVHARHGRA